MIRPVNSAIRFSPCFRYYCNYLFFHVILRLPDSVLVNPSPHLSHYGRALAFICLGRFVHFIDRLSLPPPFCARLGSISHTLSSRRIVSAPSTLTPALRLPASLPAFSPLASLRVGSPIIGRRSSPCFASGVSSPPRVVSRGIFMGFASLVALPSWVAAMSPPRRRRHVAAARRRHVAAALRRRVAAASSAPPLLRRFAFAGAS